MDKLLISFVTYVEVIYKIIYQTHIDVQNILDHSFLKSRIYVLIEPFKLKRGSSALVSLVYEKFRDRVVNLIGYRFIGYYINFKDEVDCLLLCL